MTYAKYILVNIVLQVIVIESFCMLPDAGAMQLSQRYIRQVDRQENTSIPKKNDECCICFEEKEVQAILCQSQQGHSDNVCVECLKNWKKNNNSCPLCRSQLVIDSSSSWSNFIEYYAALLVNTCGLSNIWCGY